MEEIDKNVLVEVRILKMSKKNNGNREKVGTIGCVCVVRKNVKTCKCSVWHGCEDGVCWVKIVLLGITPIVRITRTSVKPDPGYPTVMRIGVGRPSA